MRGSTLPRSGDTAGVCERRGEPADPCGDSVPETVPLLVPVPSPSRSGRSEGRAGLLGSGRARAPGPEGDAPLPTASDYVIGITDRGFRLVRNAVKDCVGMHRTALLSVTPKTPCGTALHSASGERARSCPGFLPRASAGSRRGEIGLVDKADLDILVDGITAGGIRTLIICARYEWFRRRRSRLFRTPARFERIRGRERHRARGNTGIVGSWEASRGS